MKFLFYTLLVSLLIGCGGNPKAPPKDNNDQVDDKQSNWLTDIPDYISKIPYTVIEGTYRYYSKDKGTYKVYDNDLDEWIEYPLTTEFSFTCTVTEDNKSATLNWEKGRTDFINPDDTVRGVIFIGGSYILELSGKTSDINSGYLEINKSQLRSLINKMSEWMIMEVQILSTDMEFSQVVIIRLKGFDRNHPIFECFDK